MSGQPWLQLWTRDLLGATDDLDADATLALILIAGLCNASPRGVIDNDRRKLGRVWKVSTHRAGKILEQLESTGRIRTEGEHLFFLDFLSKKNGKKMRFSEAETQEKQSLTPPPFSETQKRDSPLTPQTMKAELFQWARQEGGIEDGQELEQLWCEHCDTADRYRYTGDRFRSAWRDLCRSVSRRRSDAQRGAGHARPVPGGNRRSRSGIVDGARRVLGDFQNEGGFSDLDGRPGELATARLAR